MKKLLILSMSGGLDSTTTAFKAIEDDFDIQPITFDYGQKNYIEMVAQQNISKFMEQKFENRIKKTISINLNSLIGDTILQYQSLRDNGIIHEKTGEEFYTPNRNLMFMVLCATIGEVIAIQEDYSEISIGLGIHKHSTENYKKDYWDITPEFATRLQSLLSLNDSIKIDLYTPFVNEFKSGIIAKAIELNVPLPLTWSCYNPVIIQDEFNSDLKRFTPCKVCEACLERDSQAKKIGEYDINEYEINSVVF